MDTLPAFSEYVLNTGKLFSYESLSTLSDADLFARIHANLDRMEANNLAAFDAACDALVHAGGNATETAVA